MTNKQRIHVAKFRGKKNTTMSNQSTISASLIIDDFPANASYWRRAQCEAFGYDAPQVCDFSMGWPDQRRAAFISVPACETLAELIETYDVRGKLTVLPYPAGLGRIDQRVRYLADADRERLLHLIRAHFKNRFMITLEVLTHSMAFDPDSGALLPHTESAWVSHLAARGRRAELTRLFVCGAEVLRNVGLPCQGMVLGGMPDVSGIADGALEAIRGRGEHLSVIAAALRAMANQMNQAGPLGIMACGGSSWLRNGNGAGADARPFVIPHDEPQQTPVYHFYPTLDDPFLKLLRGQGNVEAEAARLITPDGTGGQLIELAEAGRPLNILAHAQTLNSLNTPLGLQLLRIVLERLRQRYGDRIRWQTPLEQAAGQPADKQEES